MKLRDGQRVHVTSRVGKLTVELDISEAMMPGVVSLPHGWGHGRTGTRTRIANQYPGVCVNDLTDDQDVDVMSVNPISASLRPKPRERFRMAGCLLLRHSYSIAQ